MQLNREDPTASDRWLSEYNMSNEQRGYAYIFNHENFDDKNLSRRDGTNADVENLKHSLDLLGFKVEVFNDLNHNELQDKMDHLALKDHTNNDCVLIVILSHGKNGYVYAKDETCELASIFSSFKEDRAPTLFGKPKLFFIQSCQGNKSDSGITLMKEIETDNNESLCSLTPNEQDFLIVYSTIPEYLSWRNRYNGSWFIQALCEEINTNRNNYDILALLTFVIQRVAYNFEKDKKKQIPCISSMLTRILTFKDNK